MKGVVSFAWFGERWVPVSDGARGSAALVDWLNADLQSLESAIEAVLADIDRIERGEKNPNLPAGANEAYLGTGNAFSVFASHDLIYLECEFASELKVLMTHEQVREALERYRRFVRNDERNRDVQPDAFKIGWIAEGEDAHRLATEAGLLSMKH